MARRCECGDLFSRCTTCNPRGLSDEQCVHDPTKLRRNCAECDPCTEHPDQTRSRTNCNICKRERDGCDHGKVIYDCSKCNPCSVTRHGTRHCKRKCPLRHKGESHPDMILRLERESHPDMKPYLKPESYADMMRSPTAADRERHLSEAEKMLCLEPDSKD